MKIFNRNINNYWIKYFLFILPYEILIFSIFFTYIFDETILYSTFIIVIIPLYMVYYSISFITIFRKNTADFFSLYDIHMKFNTFLVIGKIIIGLIFYLIFTNFFNYHNFTTISGYWISIYFMTSSILSYLILFISSNFMGAKYYDLMLNSPLGIKQFSEKSVLLFEKSCKEGIFFLNKSILCLRGYFKSQGDSYPQLEITQNILDKLIKYQTNINYPTLHKLAFTISNNSDYHNVINEVIEFNQCENFAWCKNVLRNEWKIPKWLQISGFIALLTPLMGVFIQIIPEEERTKFFITLQSTLSNPLSSLMTVTPLFIFVLILMLNLLLFSDYRKYKEGIDRLNNLPEEEYIIYE